MTSSTDHSAESLRTFPQRCGACDAELDTPIACSECHTVFAVSEGLSHCERLGVRETFAIDVADAERRFVELSRELHPDFFTTREANEQALSLEHSAGLNEAIAVLRDPFRRAAYLLQRWAPQPTDAPAQQMPQGFLEEMLFLREDIEETTTQDASPARDAALDAFRTQLTERRAALIDTLTVAFAQLETARAGGAGDEMVDEIRRTLNAARYITGTLTHVKDAGR